jgi:heterodisulfide reductase subunit B
MCQMNLEAFQAKASRFTGENLTISVLYLPQLLGLAVGLSDSELGLGFNLALTADLRNKLAA